MMILGMGGEIMLANMKKNCFFFLRIKNNV